MKRLIFVIMVAFSASQVIAAPPVIFTTDQDHQNMMTQLGITALRPGPSGNPNAPNAANQDEAKANPYPDWQPILQSKKGQKITTADAWWTVRRPEIVADFESQIYGKIPATVPSVRWEIVAEEDEYVGWNRVRAQKLVGRVDNSAYPDIAVNIEAMVILPKDAKGPIPLLIMFGRAAFPNPVQPNPQEMGQINAALKADLVARDPSLGPIFAKYPAYEPLKAAPFPPPAGQGPDERIITLVSDGWGVVLLDPATIQADNGAGLTRGIIGLTNHGQPRKPEDWGALRAWGWGAGRMLDYLLTRPEVNAQAIGIEGVSRYGKAALVTMAFDQRFAFGLIGSAGEGGVSPYRRNFGEAVENIASSGEYHWMAGNFLQYATQAGRLGRKTAADMPVDAHSLIALAAPRRVFISYGIPASGDAHWLDQQGSFMATVAAGEVWVLLGAKDLGIGHDYKTAKMPPVNQGLMDGQLVWRQHDGGHTDAPNIYHFAKWMDRELGRESLLP